MVTGLATISTAQAHCSTLHRQEDQKVWTTQVAYYAAEIHYLHLQYGQGLRSPSFSPSGDLLREVMGGLAEEGLMFEAFEMAEYLVDDALDALWTLAALLLSRGIPAAEDTILRYAEVKFKKGRPEDARDTLALLDDMNVRGLQVKEKGPSWSCDIWTLGPIRPRGPGICSGMPSHSKQRAIWTRQWKPSKQQQRCIVSWA